MTAHGRVVAGVRSEWETHPPCMLPPRVNFIPGSRAQLRSAVTNCAKQTQATTEPAQSGTHAAHSSANNRAGSSGCPRLLGIDTHSYLACSRRGWHFNPGDPRRTWNAINTSPPSKHRRRRWEVVCGYRRGLESLQKAVHGRVVACGSSASVTTTISHAPGIAGTPVRVDTDIYDARLPTEPSKRRQPLNQ